MKTKNIFSLTDVSPEYLDRNPLTAMWIKSNQMARYDLFICSWLVFESATDCSTNALPLRS